MATERKRRLKVFQTPLGFYDTLVATPSRAAALRAWGIHQDLFASGQAVEVTDPDLVALAQAHPGVVLKRAVGSTDRFAAEGARLPKVPPAPKRPKAPPKKPRAPAAREQPARPAADRSALDAAEARLKALDRTRVREEAAFRARQEALEREISTAQSAYVRDRKAATAAIVAARTAYRKAGGTD